jgi:hypothetical protein
VAVPRIWPSNHIFNGAGLTESSQSDHNPVEALQDQLRPYFWQTATGWTITEHNRRIDFDIGGGQVTATVALGHYATGGLLAIAIVAALEAADSGPDWASNYGVTATDKFRIGKSGANFSLLWSTGTNAYRSIGRSLGYLTVDDTGANGYVGDEVNYQSTHDLVITLTSAQVSAGTNSFALFGHNFLCSVAPFTHIRLASNATDAWATPTTQATVGMALVDQRFYFTDPAVAFYRLHVDDGSNPDGFFRGKVFLGEYVALPYCFTTNQVKAPEDFTSYQVSKSGSQFPNFRNRRQRMSLELSAIPDATYESVEDLLDSIGVGRNVILDLDPDVAVASPDKQWIYGYLPEPHVQPLVPTDYWDFQFQFHEAV